MLHVQLLNLYHRLVTSIMRFVFHSRNTEATRRDISDSLSDVMRGTNSRRRRNTYKDQPQPSSNPVERPSPVFTVDGNFIVVEEADFEAYNDNMSVFLKDLPTDVEYTIVAKGTGANLAKICMYYPIGKTLCKVFGVAILPYPTLNSKLRKRVSKAIRFRTYNSNKCGYIITYLYNMPYHNLDVLRAHEKHVRQSGIQLIDYNVLISICSQASDVYFLGGSVLDKDLEVLRSAQSDMVRHSYAKVYAHGLTRLGTPISGYTMSFDAMAVRALPDLKDLMIAHHLFDRVSS